MLLCWLGWDGDNGLFLPGKKTYACSFSIDLCMCRFNFVLYFGVACMCLFYCAAPIDYLAFDMNKFAYLF